MTPDPKTRARYIATVEEWSWLRRHLLLTHTGMSMPCFCGCRRFAGSLHHLYPRGQGGDDVPANLVPLSGDGTRACHGALTSGNRTTDYIGVCEPGEVAAGIGRNLQPHHLAYLRSRVGDWYVEKHYPRE